MGFSSSCCRICRKNDLFKTIYIDENNHGNSDFHSSEDKNNFPTQESVTEHNKNIKNPYRNKNPEKADWKDKNSEQTNAIYKLGSKGIYQSEDIGGNN